MRQPKLKLFLATLLAYFCLDIVPIGITRASEHMGMYRDNFWATGQINETSETEHTEYTEHTERSPQILASKSQKSKLARLEQLANLINLDQSAYARSSAGRDRSGSFKKSTPTSSPSPNRSNSKPSSNPTSEPTSSPSPSRSPSSNNTNNDRNSSSSNSPDRNTNRSPSNPNGGGGGISMFWLLLPPGAIAALILFGKSNKSNNGHSVIAPAAIDPETVTISKLQVALLATADDLQTQLTELVTRIDTGTESGRAELLQEAVLALLRNSEHWSHVLATSDVLPRDNAESVFNQLSIAERKNFSAETLSKVNGSLSTKEINQYADDAPAAYIVVTILLGTEHDRALYEEVRSPEMLQKALEKIAAIESDHIAVLELLWSPQTSEDSLTYDELLTEYTNMVQL
ncbi:hypothetical protein Pse7367_1659 [Thalassoporum mexicanum PCC 7367]|uniref:DUF1517 domain-containing protein n=1 Tax=Thalassoporum mexicanum TaxID=3457544 RepID=UPI00029FCF81|nr:DUF1517 domain-containing protein [Pseudanabaena sp. PCC 7367]AFY69947.1 hypothetical protein Pse7367_1659 [Pseudanabaena sp. PCC 7367]